MAITGLKFDDIIKPEMKKQFELEKDQWFPSTSDEMVEFESIGKKYKVSKKQFDKRTPGLFKLEWEGHAMIALASKMYYCLGSGKSKNKASMKGIQAMKNKHLNYKLTSKKHIQRIAIIILFPVLSYFLAGRNLCM